MDAVLPEIPKLIPSWRDSPEFHLPFRFRGSQFPRRNKLETGCQVPNPAKAPNPASKRWHSIDNLEVGIHTSSMKIGERGQVTIPKSLRNRFGLHPAEEVEFVEEQGKLILRKVAVSDSRSRRSQKLKSAVGVLEGNPEDVDAAIEDMRGR